MINLKFSYGRKLIFSLPFLILSVHFSFAQNIDVSGKVSDIYGEPLIGVSIMLPGTSTGTITDADGGFRLSTPQNAVLSFSYVGYITQQLTASGNMMVTLHEDLQNLDEVVVVGYGVMKKRDLTGSVSQVKQSALSTVPTSDFATALQGKATGVDIIKSSSNPGASTQVRIRGNRSMKASNDPLWVVDGVPTDNISDLNAADIENLEILKDASATAIYGARAANGVVLVTTRRAKEGRTSISIDSYTGFEKASRTLDMMNGAQYAELKRWVKSDSGTPDYQTDQSIFSEQEWAAVDRGWIKDASGNPVRYDPSLVGGTDWGKLGLRTGSIHSTQVTITTGSEKISGMISGNIYDHKGIQRGTDYKRHSFRSHLEMKPYSFLRFGALTSLNSSETGKNAQYGALVKANPLVSPYDEDGNLRFSLGGVAGTMYNPLFDLENDVNESATDRFTGSFYMEADIWKGLRFRTTYSPDYRNTKEGAFSGTMTTTAKGDSNNTEAYMSFRKSFRYTWDNLLNWDYEINKKNRFGFTFLQSFEKSKQEVLRARVKGIPQDYQKYYNMDEAKIILGVNDSDKSANNRTNSLTEWSFNSYMFRLNYVFSEKYIATVTGRWDGASQLAEGHKWDFFPSFSLAWRVNDENFMKNQKWLDDLKVRFGVGVTGNSAVNPYDTDGVLAQTNYGWNNGSDGALGLVPSTIRAYNLGWEKTTQYNLGLNMTVLNGRASLTLDAYKQDTKDLLQDRKLPIVYGYESVAQNVGRTQNKGIEINLNLMPVRTRDLEWSVDLFYSKNKEKIVELFGEKKDLVGNKLFIGQPINTFYDYKYLGIWQESEKEEAAKYGNKPGDVKLLDVDDSGSITAEDQVILGSSVPKWFGSVSSAVRYKNAELSFLFTGRFGQMVRNTLLSDWPTWMSADFGSLNMNYYRPDRPSTEWYIYGAQKAQGEAALGSLRYVKANYAKLQSVKMAYHLPKKWMTKVRMENVTFYSTVYNPWIITDFIGLDPENTTDTSNPPAWSMVFGVNVKF